MLLLEKIAVSGLSGRGGAHFPLARKIEAVRAQPGRPVLLVNGVESDPFSAKDAYIMRAYPREIAEGVDILRELISARSVIVSASPDSLRSLEDHLTGVTFTEAPAGLLAGEASALISYVEGGALRPRHPLVHATEAGVRGKPTLVSNVETVYQLSRLARGYDVDDRVFVTLSAGDGPRQVHQLDRPTRLRELAEGPVLVDGSHGYWLGAEENPLVRSGSIHVPGYSVAHTTAEILRAAAEASARQCGPCIFGLPSLYDAWLRADYPEVRRLCALLQKRGGCHHPDGAARVALSAAALVEGE